MVESVQYEGNIKETRHRIKLSSSHFDYHLISFLTWWCSNVMENLTEYDLGTCFVGFQHLTPVHGDQSFFSSVITRSTLSEKKKKKTFRLTDQN